MNFASIEFWQYCICIFFINQNKNHISCWILLLLLFFRFFFLPTKQKSFHKKVDNMLMLQRFLNNREGAECLYCSYLKNIKRVKNKLLMTKLRVQGNCNDFVTYWWDYILLTFRCSLVVNPKITYKDPSKLDIFLHLFLLP